MVRVPSRRLGFRFHAKRRRRRRASLVCSLSLHSIQVWENFVIEFPSPVASSFDSWRFLLQLLISGEGGSCRNGSEASASGSSLLPRYILSSLLLSSVWCTFCCESLFWFLIFFRFLWFMEKILCLLCKFGYLHSRSIELIVVTRVSSYAMLGFFPCTVVSLVFLVDTQSFLFYNPQIESLLLKVKFFLGFSALANAWKKIPSCWLTIGGDL